ncbi:MAG: hypothetical protein KGK08_13420, partial [Acidobacteriota bacterium]|nr:hypothetical protein [Acidobacteriota bacterium]
MSHSGTPTAEQLEAARRKQWHQDGEALLTFENARSWINAAGLALFAPRGAQLPAPAPSMVEAVLGAPNAAPTLGETEQARALLVRLVAEGVAVPLNLLGATSAVSADTPDFLVSAAAFPYVFTLRGDKSWKQPPSTSGALKVSPLALHTYELLSERLAMTSYDLATQLGNEVTETAVLRALQELWQHMRVLPVPQPDGAPTLWELSTRRFTKLIKTGANAGQPTALSALVTLYLGQAVLASEEEIEVFLSPLAPRSRVREVVHALVAARQLETVVIDGKSLLHVNGELPAFAPAAEAEGEEASGESIEVESAGAEGSRIRKFVPRPKKIGTGPVRRPLFASAISAAQSGETDAAAAQARPWDDERAARLARAKAPSRVPMEEEQASSERPGQRRTEAGDRRPGRSREGREQERRPFQRADRGSFGADSARSAAPRKPFERGGDAPFRKPRSARADAEQPGSAERPRFRKFDEQAGKRPYRSDKPRFDRSASSAEDRPARSYARKPSGESPFGERKPFVKRDGESRGGFGEKKPYPKSTGEGRASFGERKPFVKRDGESRGGFGEKKPYRKPTGEG